MLKIVYQAVIDFVGYDQQVVFFGDPGDLQQDFAGGYGAGRVGGIPDKNDLGARRERPADVGGIHHKIIFFTRHHFHRDAVRHDDFRLVGNKAGRGNDDFVPRVQ